MPHPLKPCEVPDLSYCEILGSKEQGTESYMSLDYSCCWPHFENTVTVEIVRDNTISHTDTVINHHKD